MAATFDSAYLLAWFERVTGRPASGDPIVAASQYLRLSEAQNRIVADLAPIIPKGLTFLRGTTGANVNDVLSGFTMTSNDGKVWGFNVPSGGNDPNGYSNYPLGFTAIFPSLTSIPDSPWREGEDYIWEGYQIRIPNNGTYTGTLYWVGVQQPADITASVQPSLFPAPMRELIVYEAARGFFEEAGRNLEMADRMEQRYLKRFARWMLALKTANRKGQRNGVLTGRTFAELQGPTF